MSHNFESAMAGLDIRQSDSDELVKSFYFGDVKSSIVESSPASHSYKHWISLIMNRFSVAKTKYLLKSIFLPIGYPKTVPPEYFRFQCWNLLQDFCSYLRGIMSTQAILQGMGVGRNDITAIQATIQVGTPFHTISIPNFNFVLSGYYEMVPAC